MLVRLVLAAAVAALVILFGVGAHTPPGAGIIVDDWSRISTADSTLIAFGAYGVVPAVVTAALILLAARQRRIGALEAAERSESRAKVALVVLVVLQLVVAPYHLLRLTGEPTVGTVVRNDTRTTTVKGYSVQSAFLEIETSGPSGKATRISPRVSDEDARRIKVGDRIATFSANGETFLGGGPTLGELPGIVGFAGLFAFLLFAIDGWLKARSGAKSRA